MKSLYKCLILIFVSALFTTSCDNWIDVDIDPNSITDGPAITEDIMLIGVEAEWFTTMNAKFETWSGFPSWLSWHAIEGSTSADMNIGPGFGNEVWNSYAGSLKHAMQLYDKAKENGNNHYQGIAGVIAASHWFYIADVYDMAPLDDALLGLEELQPTLASQEELYAHANGLLNEAIGLFQGSAGEKSPGTDDYMLQGDISKWSKFAYSLMARQAMRLAYSPNTTKTAQADLVLSYLENGMTSNDDIVAWQHLDDLANANIINDYMNRAYSGGFGLTPGNFLIDKMNFYNDPRREIMFTFSEEDPTGFVGHRAGPPVETGKTPSHYKFTYLSKSYPDYIMLYSETQFLKAEAYALKGEWALAETAMKNGASAEMTYVGVSEVDIATFLAQPSLTMPTNEEDAQKLIIEQKYISNVFRTNESYFDFIRTGYPEFDFDYMIENVYNTVTFPRRFPYPLDEIEKNPNVKAIGQSDWFSKGTTWDNKP
ncbi:SusD/RagB family nutrient-binding outer membrane lipoprotein [Arenibacter sp. M-2]|uniref:SusD/RagB family nutrient-binding outer membrane lipoprotein n=1 Tax=Arenibacter sp. M-2 TaxID=3053612 RepID=UPI0025712F3A|nr:SusD/RagB family nutrient-binding outer membrane lipoprotein [Arenibacter sp. M-2]MDL5512064.1 SusD/RagB family nutrient-binding outer membrane lipoprotein [Arenibacter sp. M-2]